MIYATTVIIYLFGWPEKTRDNGIVCHNAARARPLKPAATGEVKIMHNNIRYTSCPSADISFLRIRDPDTIICMFHAGTRKTFGYE